MGKMGQAKGKKPKSYYRKSGPNYRKQDCKLQPGMKGILITCSGNESQGVKEAYSLLNEYADQIYGPETNEVDSQQPDKESDDDISESLEKEVLALNEQHRSKNKRFKSARTGAKNVIFIQTTGIDPHRLVANLLTDLEKTRTNKTRAIQRMLPVSHTCKAFPDKIENTAQEMIYPVFHAPEAKDSTFCVMFKARNNNTIKKEPTIQLLAPMVMQGSSHIHKVNFDAPDFTVMVDVIGGVCCLSVLENYVHFKKYNLHLVANDDDPGLGEERKRKMADRDAEKQEEEKCQGGVKKTRIAEDSANIMVSESSQDVALEPKTETGVDAEPSSPTQQSPPVSDCSTDSTLKKEPSHGSCETFSSTNKDSESVDSACILEVPQLKAEGSDEKNVFTDT